MTEASRTLDDITGRPKRKVVDAAKDSVLLRPLNAPEPPSASVCPKIPLDWRLLKPWVDRLARSKVFEIGLVTSVYKGGTTSELDVDFLLRDKEISFKITAETLRHLEENGFDSGILATVEKLKGRDYQGVGGNLDLLEDLEAEFGPERAGEFRRVRPDLQKYIETSFLAFQWSYFDPTIPDTGSDHASVEYATEERLEYSTTTSDVERFRQDAHTCIGLITDVIPQLVGCDEQLKKWWNDNLPRFEGYTRRMESWVDSWRSEPRTHFWLITQPAFTLTEQSLTKLKSANLPAEVLTRLQTLKDQVYIGEAALLDAVRVAIGDADATKWRVLILIHTVKSGGEYPTQNDASVISVNFESMNPDKVRDCLQSKEFCPKRVHFEYEMPKTLEDSSGVIPDSEELGRVFQELRDISKYAAGALRLTIKGYTDRSGSKASNKALSERRATWMLQRIKDRFSQFPFAETKTEGFGEAGDGSGPEKNADDRFVEIIVEPI